MLSRLFGFLGPKPVLIQGTDKLPEGESKVIELGDPLAGGKELVLCRTGGELHALDRVCPHNEGGRIVDGPLHEGKYLMCPLHNYKFDPKTGKAVGVACPAAKVYRLQEQDGSTKIWV